jgi:hypothetical protein
MSKRTQFWIALAAIPVGLLLWFFGLGIGLGAGSSLTPNDDWIMPLALLAFFSGPVIAIGGAIWLAVLVFLRLKKPSS